MKYGYMGLCTKTQASEIIARNKALQRQGKTEQTETRRKLEDTLGDVRRAKELGISLKEYRGMK